MSIFGPDGAPLGPTPAERQSAAILAELRMGRLALRCLSVLLSEKEGRKTAIQKTRIAKIQEKYPGAVIRFGEEAERITLRLMTPDELDAADQEAQRIAADRAKELEAMATPATAPAQAAKE